MRTTIEITAAQHEALTALARRRGQRGFSLLVQEAVDGYLASLAPDETDALLALEGVLGDDEADEVQRRAAETRATWRAS
jgi:hypothetical protein